MASVTSEAKVGESYGSVRERIQGTLSHLPLAAVREQFRGLFERQPPRLVDLVRRLGGQVAESAAAVPEKEEADDLEDALAAPRVHVTDIAELLDEPSADARLLQHLAYGRLARVFAGANVPLWKRPEPRFLARRADGCEHPVAIQLPHQNAARRELAPHRRLCNTVAACTSDRGCAARLAPYKIAWHSAQKSAKTCHKVVSKEASGWIYS